MQGRNKIFWFNSLAYMLGRCISTVIKSSTVFRTNREVVLKFFFKEGKNSLQMRLHSFFLAEKYISYFSKWDRHLCFLSSTKLLCHIFIFFNILSFIFHNYKDLYVYIIFLISKGTKSNIKKIMPSLFTI